MNKKFPYFSINKLTRVISYRWLDPATGKQRASLHLGRIPEPDQGKLREMLNAKRITIGKLMDYDVAVRDGLDNVRVEIAQQARTEAMAEYWRERRRRKEEAENVVKADTVFSTKEWEKIVERSRRKMEKKPLDTPPVFDKGEEE